MKKLVGNFIVLLCLNFIACDNSQQIRLQPGDLLFRGAGSSRLSEAIDQVTQTGAETHFSHVGLVESATDSVFVLHASPEGGTCRISLHDFIYPEGDSMQVVVYRLKTEWQSTIPEAIKRAQSMLGKPYNFSYVWTDTAHYCSEFVYRAFAPDSVFELNPMTFVDPKTGNFSSGWIEYYQKLGLEIPEGQPGCNPNGMATSNKLDCLGNIR